MTNEDSNKPTKLTITFADGSTRDFDVFLAVAAEGLIAADKVEGRVAYITPQEGFSSRAFSAIAADSPVIAGLLSSITALTKAMIDSMDPLSFIKLLQAFDAMGNTEEVLFLKSKTVIKDSSGN